MECFLKTLHTQPRRKCYLTNEETSPELLSHLSKSHSTREARRPSLFGSRVPALNPYTVVLLCLNSSKKKISYTTLTASHLHLTKVALGWRFIYRISLLGSQIIRVNGSPDLLTPFGHPKLVAEGLARRQWHDPSPKALTANK